MRCLIQGPRVLKKALILTSIEWQKCLLYITSYFKQLKGEKKKETGILSTGIYHKREPNKRACPSTFKIGNKNQTNLFSYLKQPADTDDYNIQRNSKQDTKK